MSFQEFAESVDAFTKGCVEACTDPADGVTMFIDMANGAGTDVYGAFLRRCAISSLLLVLREHRIDSFNDAWTLLKRVTDVIDTSITIAGDTGDDRNFDALRALRAEVVADLISRGASLAPVQTVTLDASLPAEVVAHRFYGDATRADELVRRNKVSHPAFMPLTIEAKTR